MPDFWYSALTDAGVVREGVLFAPDETTLENQLREKGAFLIRTEVREKRAAVRTTTDGKVDRKELLAFLEYVAGSFDVGIPILEALDDVAKRLQSKRLRKIIGEIRFAVSEEGKSLSGAMSEHPMAFPELCIGTIRAGEASGELGYALRQLVEYMDWQETIASQLKQATMYPVIVVGAVTLLVIGLIGFVFPRILPLLKGQKTLPLPTRIILRASEIVRADWLAVLVVFNAIVLTVYFIHRTQKGRLFIDGLVLRLPVVGGVIRDVNMARVVTYLSLFYRTGVELVLSLEIIERIITNRAVSRAVGSAREQVIQGISIASALGQSALFPNVVLRSVALGEATGNLDQALARTKEFYNREIPASVRRMITVLQPLLIAMIGGVILMVALAIMLPILNIYASIGVRH
ncbi:MAG TPA: type II secretion system F family protein [Gemmatimonadaceae bacterium]|nr:type II secretion system F family protein [Gemmatimonadaceae bacterium]